MMFKGLQIRGGGLYWRDFSKIAWKIRHGLKLIKLIVECVRFYHKIHAL